MEALKLYMLLLGCKPPGRFTEQHDVFFGIAGALPELVPSIIAAWPEAPKIHIDAWREVTAVDGYRVSVVAKQALQPQEQQERERRRRQLPRYCWLVGHRRWCRLGV